MAADLDNFHGEAPVNADLDQQINRAYRAVARRIGWYQMGVALTLSANVWIYDLEDVAFARPMLAVEIVRIDGVPLMDWRQKPGMLSQAEMDATYPGWPAGGTAGTIVGASQIGRKLYVYPKPNAGGTAHVDGYALPVLLSDANTTSELPEALDAPIVALAAIYAATPQVSEEEGLARLASYDAAASAEIESFASANREMRIARGAQRASRMAGR